MTLTAEGRLFLLRCQRILGELAAAEREISDTHSAPRGKLRVSLPLVGGLLNPVLAEFVRRYPEIELETDFSDRRVDVIEEGFDAVVRVGETEDSRLMSRQLGTFHLQLVASPDYLRQMGIRINRRNCKAMPACCTNFPRPAKWNPADRRMGKAARRGYQHPAGLQHRRYPDLRRKAAGHRLFAGFCREARTGTGAITADIARA